jgi:hypothetical protein
MSFCPRKETPDTLIHKSHKQTTLVAFKTFFKDAARSGLISLEVVWGWLFLGFPWINSRVALAVGVLSFWKEMRHGKRGGRMARAKERVPL